MLANIDKKLSESVEEDLTTKANLKRRQAIIASSLASLVNRRENIRNRKHLQNEIGQIETQLVQWDSRLHMTEAVRSVISRGISESCSTQALFNKIVNADTPTIHQAYNNLVCVQCQANLAVSSSDSKLVCQRCGLCTNVEPEHPTETIAISSYNDSGYNKYLVQFHPHTKNPPRPVLSLLFYELSKVHMMLDLKINPVAIAQILRKNDCSQWVYMSQRICKLLTAKKIPCLSDHLIYCLVFRYKQIHTVLAEITSSSKAYLTFEYLTCQFLFMEQLPELAHCFNIYNKSRLVQRKANSILILCCDQLKKIQQSPLNWEVP